MVKQPHSQSSNACELDDYIWNMVTSGSYAALVASCESNVLKWLIRKMAFDMKHIAMRNTLSIIDAASRNFGQQWHSDLAFHPCSSFHQWKRMTKRSGIWGGWGRSFRQGFFEVQISVWPEVELNVLLLDVACVNFQQGLITRTLIRFVADCQRWLNVFWLCLMLLVLFYGSVWQHPSRWW